jgi:hypothetical protein
VERQALGVIVVPALWNLRKEYLELEVSLEHIMSSRIMWAIQ